jgi:type IV pilus assembly protein PilP
MSTDRRACQREGRVIVSALRRMSSLPSISFIVLGGLAIAACGGGGGGLGEGLGGGSERTEGAVSSSEDGAKSGPSKTKRKRGKKGGRNAEKAADAQGGGDQAVTAEILERLAKEHELPESVFIETDENRDPFRSFLTVFAVQALPEEEFVPRPPVVLEDVSLDELRLIAIVSGEGGNPRAMLVDPDGKGWVVRRGDYVGRGERVRLGPGQPERIINWRVVRVRPDRVILVREDPVQAGPPVTRVIRLYPEEETEG